MWLPCGSKRTLNPITEVADHELLLAGLRAEASADTLRDAAVLRKIPPLTTGTIAANVTEQCLAIPTTDL
jgi:hypothetical protein